MFGNLKHVNHFDEGYKKFLLKEKGAKIDEGIRELVDAINSVDVFCTMNSCQGSLIEESSAHCPKTYVDFFVLYHQYQIAQKLIINLVHKFGTNIKCNLEYQADFDVDEDDYIQENGMIDMRYSIEIPDDLINKVELYKNIIEEIKKFAKKYND